MDSEHSERPSSLGPLGYGLAWAGAVALAFTVSPAAGDAALWLSCLAFMALLYRARQVRLQLLLERSALLRSEAMLRAKANHDSLTGLANRMLLTDRFNFTVERSKRNHVSFALLMIDLNNFKRINDTYGHAAGDQVLTVQANRLLGAVRTSDTVARLGGDEFVVLIESFDDPKETIHVGRKLIECLSQPIELQDGTTVNVGASVGIAHYPDDGQDLSEMLNVADRGMYDCKTSGLMELQ